MSALSSFELLPSAILPLSAAILSAAQGGADGVVRVWDVADGTFRAEKCLTQFAIGATFQKESPPVRDAQIATRDKRANERASQPVTS